MRKLICICCCLWFLAIPVSAMEIQAPKVPSSGEAFMPDDTDSLEGGIRELIRKAMDAILPALRQACWVSMGVICAAMVVSILQTVSTPVKTAAQTAGTVGISALLVGTTDSMVTLGADTVRQISEYGKLLLPVMTTAMATQGGITSSAALYAGTAMFDSLLMGIMSGFLVPGVWLYLAISIANCVTGQKLLKNFAQLLKGTMVFTLKILLTVFTTYLSLTGVVSGTTDAAALKAARVTISSVVPVVGGVLSDASEAVLVSTSLLRSAAGVYGIFAVIALFLGPFIKLSAHYAVLKLTSALCAVFGEKPITDLISDFSSAMGLLVAMTGAGCLMTLISTVCFLREVG